MFFTNESERIFQLKEIISVYEYYSQIIIHFTILKYLIIYYKYNIFFIDFYSDIMI